jgi:hypothetical protein
LSPVGAIKRTEMSFNPDQQISVSLTSDTPIQTQKICITTMKELFQVLTAASMKMTVFWDVVPPPSAPDDGGSKHL